LEGGAAAVARVAVVGARPAGNAGGLRAGRVVEGAVRDAPDVRDRVRAGALEAARAAAAPDAARRAGSVTRTRDAHVVPAVLAVEHRRDAAAAFRGDDRDVLPVAVVRALVGDARRLEAVEDPR